MVMCPQVLQAGASLCMLRAAAFMASRPFSGLRPREEAAAALAALEFWGWEPLGDWEGEPLAGVLPVLDANVTVLILWALASAMNCE